VVCGVGHETDLTLADLAAICVHPRPPQPPSLPRPSKLTRLGLDARALALARVLTRTLERERQRLDTATLRLGRPAGALAVERQRLAAAETAPAPGASRPSDPASSSAAFPRPAPARRRRVVSTAAARADRVGYGSAGSARPATGAERGYAWIEAGDGRPVLSVRRLMRGDTIQAVWADGRAHAEVLQVELSGQPSVTKGD